MGRAKHPNRIAVYFTDAQFVDVLRNAAKFDKLPAEWVRFEILLSMYGSLGMSEAAVKSIRSAFEAQKNEGDDE